jgi:nucleoid-associated protein YgaU
VHPVDPVDSTPPDGTDEPSAQDETAPPLETVPDAAPERFPAIPSGTETEVGGAHLHTVRPGDNLWTIAEARLVQVEGGPITDADVVSYWVRTVELNRSRLRSGDPDLIFPGEIIELPLLEGS